MAQRIALFDNLKGIAILLVVLGHFVEQQLMGTPHIYCKQF